MIRDPCVFRVTIAEPNVYGYFVSLYLLTTEEKGSYRIFRFTKKLLFADFEQF